jgi:hypothetical protein
MGYHCLNCKQTESACVCEVSTIVQTADVQPSDQTNDSAEDLLNQAASLLKTMIASTPAQWQECNALLAKIRHRARAD